MNGTPTYFVVLFDHAYKTGDVVGAHGSRNTANGHALSLHSKEHYMPEVVTSTDMKRKYGAYDFRA